MAGAVPQRAAERSRINGHGVRVQRTTLVRAVRQGAARRRKAPQGAAKSLPFAKVAAGVAADFSDGASCWRRACPVRSCRDGQPAGTPFALLSDLLKEFDDG